MCSERQVALARGGTLASAPLTDGISYYVGQSNDIARRYLEHMNGVRSRFKGMVAAFPVEKLLGQAGLDLLQKAEQYVMDAMRDAGYDLANDRNAIDKKRGRLRKDFLNFCNMTYSNIASVLSLDRPDARAVQRVASETFDWLQLVNGGEVWKDLTFLKAVVARVKRLRVSGIFDGFAGLDALTELTDLDLEDYTPAPVADFSSLTKLRNCRMAWYAKFNLGSLMSLAPWHTQVVQASDSNRDPITRLGQIAEIELAVSELLTEAKERYPVLFT